VGVDQPTKNLKEMVNQEPEKGERNEEFAF
jgi:hypothetical protein